MLPKNVILSNIFFIRHSVPVIGIVAAAAFIFGKAQTIHPFDADNLLALSLASRTNPAHYFLGSFVSYLPGYRPLAYLILWAHHQLLGLNIPSYFLVNFLICCAAVLCVYFMIVFLTRSRLSAIIASLLMLANGKMICAFIWIGERQSALAMLFGFSALLLAYIHWKRPLQRWLAWPGIFLLLLASSLCKEYGLSFSAAVLMLELAVRPRDWKAAAGMSMLSVFIYAALRFSLGGGAAASYNCEDMGFFTTMHVVCYSDMAFKAKIAQYLYNDITTFFSTIMPCFFDSNGMMVRPTSVSFVKSILVLVLAITGLARYPRTLLPMLALIAANAALSFMIVRTRNQVVGDMGFYSMAGAGVAVCFGMALRWRRVALAAGMAVLAGIFFTNARRTNAEISSIVARFASLDPCAQAALFAKDIDPSLVRQIKLRYSLDNPDCGREKAVH
jgi:hypothetical protein